MNLCVKLSSCYLLFLRSECFPQVPLFFVLSLKWGAKFDSHSKQEVKGKVKVKVKVKLSLCLTKYHAVEAYEGVEVYFCVS